MALKTGDGHGWVIPRQDGTKARCGGPAICDDCKSELRIIDDRKLKSAEFQLLMYAEAAVDQGFITEELSNAAKKYRATVRDIVKRAGG
jgi:hypothetical protein